MKNYLIKLAARALNARQSLWVRIQLRALTLYFKTAKAIEDGKRSLMARFDKPIEVRIDYADRKPRVFYMRSDSSLTWPEMGAHDGHGIVVGCHFTQTS